MEEALKQKANLLRQSLEKSQITTEKIMAALDTFDRRLLSIDSAIRPIQEIMPVYMRCHENVSKCLRKTEVIVSQFDRIREAEVVIFKGPGEDLNGFLDAMDQLIRISRFFNSRKSYQARESTLQHINRLLADATRMTENEFHKMLTAVSKPVDPMSLFDCLPSKTKASDVSTANHDDITDISANDELATESRQEELTYKLPTLISPRYINPLHHLAARLVLVGHHTQCLNIYRNARSNALQKSLEYMGVQKIGKDELQKMQWETLEAKIPNWIDLMRICVKLLFAGERKLCDQVFEGIEDSFLDQCFMEVTSSSLTTLLSYGEAVVKIKQSPEKLFMLLDMYEMMCELQPELPGNVDSASWRIQDRGSGGRVAVCTINFADFTGSSKQLGSKIKQCKDQAQSYIFLMNNIHYMVTSVRKTEAARELLGADWIQRQRRVVQQNANNYRRVSWTKVLEIISSKGLLSSSGGSSNPIENSVSTSAPKDAIKERFKNFNTQYEELYHKQCLWKVHDRELRESLQLAVSEVLLPAYRSFLKRFGPIVENSKSKCIQYSPEDIERMLGELFEGKTPS
ncbi:Exocyst subunit exo70 family protein A1 [Rhynchospora pubera]|uniref:Exocyst subunit Exo70 family protein n=1 Tax=Rhynchospora pubera TaxID=906938 RepID=A0AAV8DWV3_9POAL|nr:Exocyst subunit exo70 family protein A1 [Rhynchospora pubera]